VIWVGGRNGSLGKGDGRSMMRDSRREADEFELGAGRKAAAEMRREGIRPELSVFLLCSAANVFDPGPLVAHSFTDLEIVIQMSSIEEICSSRQQSNEVKEAAARGRRLSQKVGGRSSHAMHRRLRFGKRKIADEGRLASGNR
jgi:hypothetical protein